MSAKKSDEAIPLKVLEMAIVMVNAADQCDQAGQWDRDHRRACQHILDWYNSNDYKITCDKAGVKDAPPKSNADRIRQMTDEELADIMQGQCACCAYQLTGCTEKECKDGVYEWLKQEAETDDERRQDQSNDGRGACGFLLSNLTMLRKRCKLFDVSDL